MNAKWSGFPTCGFVLASEKKQYGGNLHETVFVSKSSD